MPQSTTPSQAQILLAWDECGDVIHCNDSIILPSGDDESDTMASSLLRQCGANVSGVGLPQKQQQQQLDSKRSRLSTGNVRGNKNSSSIHGNDRSLLLLGRRRRQQEALLRKIRQMEYIGIKDSEEMELLEAELNGTAAVKETTMLGIAGRPFSLSNCEISINSINSHGGINKHRKSKENSGPNQRRKEDSNPLESSSICSPYTSVSTEKTQRKGGTRTLPVRASIDRSGKQPLQRRHCDKKPTPPVAEMADKDDYQWNDGNLRALRRKMEASRDIVRDIGHAIEGDMLHVHQSCRAIANIRGGKQPILREELHRLAARALASICVEMSHRHGRSVLKLWSQGVRRDIRSEQLLKLRRCRSLDRLVVLLKRLTKERLTSVWLCWLAECERRRQLELKLKATIIQSAIRRELAVAKLAQLRSEKREWARRTIQRLCRGCLARMVFRTMIRQRNRLLAALALQCFIRCCLARIMLKRLKLEQRKQNGAVMMQKISRGRKGRKIALQALDRRRRRTAAVHIQRISRGRKDRKAHAEHKKYLASIKRNTAATALQAQIRRIRDTKIVLQLHKQREEERRKMQLERERVTVILQRIYRGHQGRLTMRRIQSEQLLDAQQRYKSATCIQSFYRSRVARDRVRLIRRTTRAFMIREARQWIETWKDDENTLCCYYNKVTGEILSSPPITGYARISTHDAHGPLLFLQNGVVVWDPSNIIRGDVTSDDTRMSRQLPVLVCQGCEAKSFTLYCKECEDIWCEDCDAIIKLEH